MMRRLNPGPKGLILIPWLLTLIFLIACGGAATSPAPQATDAPAAGSSAAATSAPVAATSAPVGQAPAQAASATTVPEAVVPSPDDWVSRGKHGRTMNWVARNNPGFWDVHYGASLTTTLTPSGPRFNQLLEYDPVNPDEIIGDLAESWEMSDDGTIYTFHLADAQWTDGEPVKASDIACSAWTASSCRTHSAAEPTASGISMNTRPPR